MSYTFKALQDECIRYGFNDSTYRSRFQVWLNEAQHIALRREPIREVAGSYLFPIVSGTATYALPTGFTSVAAITDIINGNALSSMSKGWYDLNFNSSLGIGQPYRYVLDELGITFWPTPNQTSSVWLKMRYFTDPVDMSADADVPTLNAAHQHLLVSYAVSRGYRSEDDPAQAQAFMADFERGLSWMGNDRRAENRDGSMQVDGMWNQRHPVRT